jgi:beta-galactosidase
MSHSSSGQRFNRRVLLKSLAAGGFSLAALRLFPAVKQAAPPSATEAPPALPPNTPRPTTMEGVGQPLLRLDGMWRFHPDAPEEFHGRAFTPDGGGWRDIAVPGEWSMQGAEVAPGRAAAYRREFDLPADWDGLACKLRFDSVHAGCHVWVNGIDVGAYEGGFEEFEFDVTAALKPGRNTIAVAVRGDAEADMLSFGSRYAAHPLGGITRKVTLFAVPTVHVSELEIRTLRDAAGGWRLEVEADVSNAGATRSAAGVLEFALDGAGFAIVPFGPLSPADRAGVSHAAAMPDVQSWDCEHPRLHALTIVCRSGASQGSTVVRRVGFREVSVRGAELLINGRPVKMRGVNRHEVHLKRGRAANAEGARADVELFRAANINLIRTSHYPPPEELLDACDELGMFVDCEAALCWVGMRSRPPWKDHDASAATWYPALLRANLANVAAHRHHPCVILWSLANESPWTENFARVNGWMKRIDPTRPTIFHSGGIRGHGTADLANSHYPKPDELAGLLIADGRPVFVGEHAHVQSYNRAEIAADPGVREIWGRTFEDTARTIFKTPHLAGCAIWAGIDELFELPDGKRVGYGEWGVVDVLRRHKPEYWHVKKAFSPVRVGVRTLAAPAPGEPLRVPVWNRSDFSDLREFVIHWRAGERTGTIASELPPRARGELVLPWETTPGPVVTLRLEFFDPRQVLIDEEEIMVGEQPMAPPIRPVPETRMVATGPAEPGGRGPWAFQADLAAGFASITRNGEVVLRAADLMLLPLEEMTAPTTNDYRADIPPLHHACMERTVARVEPLQSREGVGARLQLGWREAAGELDLVLEHDGRLSAHGRFTIRADMAARQCGLVFWLPGRFSRIAWSRKGIWSTYPADHIGRPIGEAWGKLAGDYAAGEPSHTAWSHDRGPLGPHDFCATRTFVHWAELRADDGSAVRIEGGGRQAVRAWIETDGRIGVLVAEHAGGGNEPGFAHFARGPRLLQPGDELELSASLILIEPKS